MKKVVILGGGIGGLSLCHFLNEFNKISLRSGESPLQISLIEKSSRCGGWIRSNHSPSPNFFLHETGPHSLPVIKSYEILRMAYQLKILDQLIFAPPRLPRWIRADNVFMTPGQVFSSQKLTTVKSVANEMTSFRWKSKDSEQEDCSIYDFFHSRFGPHIADVLISAVVNGIFAADPKILSMRSSLPELWEMTMEKGSGSIIRSALGQTLKNVLFKSKNEAPSIKLLKEWGMYHPDLGLRSMFSFRNGLSTLTRALSERLSRDVDLSLDHTVRFLHYDSFSKKFMVEAVSGTVGTVERLEADYVFSCIPSHSLSQILKQSTHSFSTPSHENDEDE